MNLFSFAQLKPNKKLLFISLSSICFISIITSQSAHANDLNIKLTNNFNTLKQLNYRKLISNSLISNLPRPSISLSASGDKTFSYLTFYSKKNEKLNATFENGAYLIKYTRRWK